MIKIHLTICGVVITENYKSDLLKITEAHVKIQKEEYKNCIELEYYIENTMKDKSILDNYISKQLDYLYYLFCLLLVRPSDIVYSKILIDGKELKLTPRKIESPRRLYYLLSFLKLNINPVLTSYSCRINEKGIKLYEDMIKSFFQKNEQFKSYLFLPLRWFQKACDELSSIDRLISFWISFNSLYQNSAPSERASIKTYVSKNLSNELSEAYVNKWKKNIEKLSQYSITLGRGKNKYEVSDELNILLKSSAKKYNEVVVTMLLTIYGIRNSLFHGNINIDDLEKEEEIETAEILLSEFLKNFISFSILNKSIINNSFVVSEQGNF